MLVPPPVDNGRVTTLDGQGWIRLAGDVKAAPIPKGYITAQHQALEVLLADEEWQAWWAQSGFDYLFLYRGWYTKDTEPFAPLSRRFYRKDDHVEGALVRLFGHRDKETWSLEQAQAEAREDVHAFFILAAKRLKMSPPPPLPRRVFVSKGEERRRARGVSNA